MLQSYVNLGVAETPVHFRAVEMVAIHGKDNALYLVCLLLVLEADFHSLLIQVGNKHVLIAAPADFCFENVLQFVLRSVRLFQAAALDISLAVSQIQTVL